MRARPQPMRPRRASPRSKSGRRAVRAGSRCSSRRGAELCAGTERVEATASQLAEREAAASSVVGDLAKAREADAARLRAAELEGELGAVRAAPSWPGRRAARGRAGGATGRARRGGNGSRRGACSLARCRAPARAGAIELRGVSDALAAAPRARGGGTRAEALRSELEETKARPRRRRRCGARRGARARARGDPRDAGRGTREARRRTRPARPRARARGRAGRARERAVRARRRARGAPHRARS